MAEDKKTILVVDDDKALRETMAMVLDSIGYNVIESDSPSDAVKKIDKADGMLLDNNIITNDSDDGLNFAKDARAKGFKGPIIVFSGRFTPDFVAPPEYGVDYTFGKPVRLAVLQTAFNKAFTKRGGDEASRTPAALKSSKTDQPASHEERAENMSTSGKGTRPPL